MDKYELPIAVADSVSELAQMRKVKKTSISQRMSHQKNPNSKDKYPVKYIKVKLEED